MFETLYKTAVPEELEFAEYYQPHLDVASVNGRPVYVVREKHGWYSDKEKLAFHSIQTLSTEEGYPTFEEAEERYRQQLIHRAREGFIHSFSFDPLSEGRFKYRRLAN